MPGCCTGVWVRVRVIIINKWIKYGTFKLNIIRCKALHQRETKDRDQSPVTGTLRENTKFLNWRKEIRDILLFVTSEIMNFPFLLMVSWLSVSKTLLNMHELKSIFISHWHKHYSF